MSNTHITLQSISYPYFDEDKNILVNDSIILEAIAPEHAIPLYKAIKANADDLSSFLPWAKNNTIEAEERFVSTRMLEMRDKKSFTYVIKVSGQIVGCIDLQQVNFVGEQGNCNVGYFLFPDYRGRGYIKAALSAITEIFYVSYQIARFNLIINCKNHKSIKVAQNLGAKLEGVLRKFHNGDCYLYGYVLPHDLYEQNKEDSEKDCFAVQEIDKDLPEILQHKDTLELARLLVRSGQSTRKAIAEYLDGIKKAQEALAALEQQEALQNKDKDSSAEAQEVQSEKQDSQAETDSTTETESGEVKADTTQNTEITANTETNSSIPTAEAEEKTESPTLEEAPTQEDASSLETASTESIIKDKAEEETDQDFEDALDEALEDISELEEETASDHKQQ